MEAFNELLIATRQVITDGLERLGERIPELVALQELASAPHDMRPSRPGGIERTEGLLPACVELAKSDPDRRLAQALLDAAPHLHWVSPYDEHGGGEAMDPLRREYVCTLLVGPEPFRHYRGAFRQDGMLIVFTLQCPGVYYPPHSHQAREIYHVVCGRSDWQFGKEWTVRNSGDWIFHPSGVHHAMRTHDEPLLAMAAWIDGLEDSRVTFHG